MSYRLPRLCQGTWLENHELGAIVLNLAAHWAHRRALKYLMPSPTPRNSDAIVLEVWPGYWDLSGSQEILRRGHNQEPLSLRAFLSQSQQVEKKQKKALAVSLGDAQRGITVAGREYPLIECGSWT